MNWLIGSVSRRINRSHSWFPSPFREIIERKTLRPSAILNENEVSVVLIHTRPGDSCDTESDYFSVASVVRPGHWFTIAAETFDASKRRRSETGRDNGHQHIINGVQTVHCVFCLGGQCSRGSSKNFCTLFV